MSEQDPIQAAITARRTRKSFPWGPVLLVLAALSLLVAGGWLLYRLGSLTASQPPPNVVVELEKPQQPYTKITHTTSIGGSQTKRGSAEGGSLDLSTPDGKIDAKDIRIPATAMNFVDIGTVTGGAFSGGFSATSTGLFWVRMIGLAACLGCGALAYLNLKKNPLDWHYTASLAGGSLAGLIAVFNPEFGLWCLFGGGAALCANLLPSIQGSKLLSVGQHFDDFVSSDPDVKAKWDAYRARQVPRSDKNILDFIKSTNV